MQSKIAYSGQLRKPTEFERVIDKKLGPNDIPLCTDYKRARSTESFGSNPGKILTSNTSTDLDDVSKEHHKQAISVL